MSAYNDFKNRFKLLASKNPHLVVNTLSNIFTMRLIGNKTHGDLAEIGMAEFINQFMYDFKSIHVGKDLFRAKEHEEDIVIINEITKVKFPLSLKAYGDGPLQLSTDSDQKMFPFLETQGKDITNNKQIKAIF
ncbi:MAG: SspI [Candidatus Magasanikbacteria bacterium GW2011_GWA2_45_39]|uniref:SspI n=2 Tax=Candidatus Magasanikiibacteriota TaxID=1752731 RepID=A0A0G1MZS7_9BACT|nr:MAG: SspI [Candidatus Magasanikbacteria bacterium GW2011_GWA2_45_39]KKU13592.1 MAG: SspI [Candidatus Magasanikbacteria bacterium GW2011_GWC2_45_8]